MQRVEDFAMDCANAEIENFLFFHCTQSSNLRGPFFEANFLNSITNRLMKDFTFS